LFVSAEIRCNYIDFNFGRPSIYTQCRPPLHNRQHTYHTQPILAWEAKVSRCEGKRGGDEKVGKGRVAKEGREEERNKLLHRD